MKNIIIGIFLLANAAKSQETDVLRKIQEDGNKVKITHTNGRISRGYAYALADDSITIYVPANTSLFIKMKKDDMSTGFKSFPATEIENVSFWSKNQLKGNFIAGILLGTITGILVGYIKENGIAIPIGEYATLDFTHPPHKTNYPKIILTGAAIGSVTGIIFGSISQKFILKGKSERFREKKDKMSHYMFRDNPVPAF
jgi:hypothetical protein